MRQPLPGPSCSSGSPLRSVCFTVVAPAVAAGDWWCWGCRQAGRDYRAAGAERRNRACVASPAAAGLFTTAQVLLQARMQLQSGRKQMGPKGQLHCLRAPGAPGAPTDPAFHLDSWSPISVVLHFQRGRGRWGLLLPHRCTPEALWGARGGAWCSSCDTGDTVLTSRWRSCPTRPSPQWPPAPSSCPLLSAHRGDRPQADSPAPCDGHVATQGLVLPFGSASGANPGHLHGAVAASSPAAAHFHKQTSHTPYLLLIR